MNIFASDRLSSQRRQEENTVRSRLHTATVATALTLASALLWLLVHRYRGMDNDAQLYAFQALARLHPNLLTDLYLQYESQDRYTVFSPIYAWFIGLLGLDRAALCLMIVCIVSFLTAAWVLSFRIAGWQISWLAICAVIIVPGDYGGAGVFHYADNYLTARLAAQSLIVISLACFYSRWRFASAGAALAAMFIHPLMALPGILLLLCLALPIRASLLGAAAGILATVVIALFSEHSATFARLFPIMDQPWLNVVQERSHFLFLQYWNLADWNANAKPFVGLTIAALVLSGPSRRLAQAAIIVGAAGLLVALVHSYVAPVAILVQGQAWRWLWISVFVGVLLLAPTGFTLWREERVGPLCTVLLVLAWTFVPVDGTQCLLAALTLWLGRAFVSRRAAAYLRWAAHAVIVAVLIWTLANSWTTLMTSPADSVQEPLLVTRLRNLFGLETFAVAAMGLIWFWLTTRRSTYPSVLTAAALLGGCAYVAPGSLSEMYRGPTAAEMDHFSEWRNTIPPFSTVLIAGKFDPGSFAWFTLYRPNYLVIDQSAGVVFSRSTALEVNRRSELLIPLMDQDWKLFSRIQAGQKGESQKDKPFRPLTAANLRGVCSDPALGFVIAKENVGFSPISFAGVGVWHLWNLYDCRQVRAARQGA